MTDEIEIDIINDLIVKRQKLINSGNESAAKRIEEEFEKKGFTIKDNNGTTTVKNKKTKDTI